MTPDDPGGQAEEERLSETEKLIIALQQSGDSICMPDADGCGLVQVDEEERCMCWNIEPFVVQADPEEPDHWDPGPAPEDLQAPIWPDPGSSPSGHDPGDPCEWDCPIVFDVKLWCETSLVRGEPGRCELEVDPPGVLHSIDGWTFKGKGDGYDGLNAWTQSYHQDYWEGPIVARGEVRVDFKVADEFDNTFPVAAKTEVAVLPRQGSEWDWDQQHWELREDEPPTAPFSLPVAGSPGILLGANCNYPECDGDYRVQPHIPDSIEQGYTADEVPNGPNNGLWYVAGAGFYMDRQSQVNPEVRPGGTSFTLPSAQATECGQNEMSFFEFNDCKSVDVSGMITGILAHEGHGSGGMGNGHEAQAWSEASKPENDIRGLAEGAVHGTQTQLRMLLQQELEDPADHIRDAGDAEPSGNWSGQVWAWDYATTQYVLLAPWSF